MANAQRGFSISFQSTVLLGRLLEGRPRAAMPEFPTSYTTHLPHLPPSPWLCGVSVCGAVCCNLLLLFSPAGGRPQSPCQASLSIRAQTPDLKKKEEEEEEEKKEEKNGESKRERDAARSRDSGDFTLHRSHTKHRESKDAGTLRVEPASETRVPSM